MGLESKLRSIAGPEYYINPNYSILHRQQAVSKRPIFSKQCIRDGFKFNMQVNRFVEDTEHQLSKSERA